MKHSTLVVAISASVFAESLFAQVEVHPANGWQFEATPYLWAAGLNGWSRFGANTPTVPLDASFSDVWRDLDFGAMASFEARKGRWAILFDSIYIKVSQTSDPLLGGALGTAELGLKETILQLAGAYRVYDSAVVPVDVLAGVRYAHISGDLSFSPSALLPGGGSRSDSVGWTDGFVGVRATYALTDKCSLVGYADAGAGGTKHSWQVLAGANYAFSKTIVGKVGYRILSMDYEKPDFLYDVKTSGFFAGVGIRF
jgi:opacity protein-like surface antigen